MTYTKGEWKVAEENPIFITCNGWLVATVASGWGDTLTEQIETRQANARLIAAAPDMYEALKDLAKYIQFNKGNAAPIYEKAIAAINKAEGK